MRDLALAIVLVVMLGAVRSRGKSRSEESIVSPRRRAVARCRPLNCGVGESLQGFYDGGNRG
ncbi:MAG: hypothetical protein LC624_05340, partial [Halobacteriales archaeon]|nr:hypothetical protein [Halobacteriales archaeon]